MDATPYKCLYRDFTSVQRYLDTDEVKAVRPNGFFGPSLNTESISHGRDDDK